MRALTVWFFLLSCMFAVDWDDAKLQQSRHLMYIPYESIQNDSLADHGLQKHLERKFGFQAYKANFFLPVCIADRAYPTYDPADSYRQIEAEFQYSFNIDLFSDLLTLNELYGVAMTSFGFWQMYSTSSPFREVNYNPEIYILFPLVNDAVGLKTLKLTYSHVSNGQGDIDRADINTSNCLECGDYWRRSRSRAWNYISSVFEFQYDSFLVDLTLWTTIDVRMFNIKDDNPDIVDYYGWGELGAIYFYGAHQFEIKGRLNPMTGYGAVRAGWSYPFFGRESIYWYVKGFSGYGESLIDYDRYVNKIGFGFSFFR
ncbi:MAG TPA: hypothetical protein ENL04_02625 [Sulfuricurvum sp.]|nr:hypothetical protein [Sulfuricurvum sp.]